MKAARYFYRTYAVLLVFYVGACHFAMSDTSTHLSAAVFNTKEAVRTWRISMACPAVLSPQSAGALILAKSEGRQAIVTLLVAK